MAKIYNGGIYVSGNKYPNKIYVSGSKIGKATWSGDKHVWSDYVIEGVANSLTFKPDETSGGLQGDFSYGCGTGSYPNMVTPGDITLEIDPAGGTGYFSLKSRFSNNCEKISLLTYSYESSTNIASDSIFKFTKNDSGLAAILNTYEGGIGSTTYSRVSKIFNTLNNYGSKLTSDKDCTVYFSIGANNTSSASYGELKIIGFYDEFGGLAYMKDNVVRDPKGYNTLPVLKGKAEMTIMKWWQKPNVLYYVNMGFVDIQFALNNYVSGVLDLGSDSIIASSSSSNFEITSTTLYLFIEFGVSVGGSTIYWNGNETSAISSQGISTTVPSDIYKYLSFTLTNPDNSESHYTISASSILTTGSINSHSYKIVQCQLKTNGKNTEKTNTSDHIHQQYLLRDLTNTADGTTTNNYAAAKYSKGGTSTVSFKIKRAATTDNWNIKIKASLDYESGKMHYKGSTTTSDVVPTFNPDTRTDLEEEILGY